MATEIRDDIPAQARAFEFGLWTVSCIKTVRLYEHVLLFNGRHNTQYGHEIEGMQHFVFHAYTPRPPVEGISLPYSLLWFLRARLGWLVLRTTLARANQGNRELRQMHVLNTVDGALRSRPTIKTNQH